MDLLDVYKNLPYRLGSKEYEERFEEAIKNKEEPVEVNCFGTHDYKILDEHYVKIRDKHGYWLTYEYVECPDICAVCGRLMLVRVIKGTTWLPLCSEKCYKKFNDLIKKRKKKK